MAILVIGLLATALFAAAAAPPPAATFAMQPGGQCEPTLLASNISLLCSMDTPTMQCCELLLTSVDFGGGVPCLFRVAAEMKVVFAGLNSTHLLTLYTFCGGLRPRGAHLAAASLGYDLSTGPRPEHLCDTEGDESIASAFANQLVDSGGTNSTEDKCEDQAPTAAPAPPESTPPTVDKASSGLSTRVIVILCILRFIGFVVLVLATIALYNFIKSGSCKLCVGSPGLMRRAGEAAIRRVELQMARQILA